MDAVTLAAAKADARRRYNKKGLTARGCVCLVADDLYASHYTWLMPKVEALGGRLTFAYYSSGVNNGASHMTSAQVLDAFTRGHEIASHSAFHPDMTTLTPTQRSNEWVQPKTELLALTGVTPLSWIYPVSARNAATDAEAYYHYQRTYFGVNGRYVVPMDDDHVPFAVGRFSLITATLLAAKELVLLAAHSPVRVIIYTHDISSGGAISTTDMQTLLDLIQANNVPLVTLQEAFPAHRPVPDKDFVSFTNVAANDVWATSSTGSGTSSAAFTGTGPPGMTANATSLKLSSTDATATRTATLTAGIPVRGGRPFSFSEWIKLTKTSGTGGAYAWADEYDISGNLVASTPIAAVEADTAGAWTFVSKVWNLYPQTTRVVPRENITNLVGDAYFTSVWLAETIETMMTPPPPRFAPNRNVELASGEATIPRDDVTTETTVGTGSLRLTYFTAQKTEDITQVRIFSGTQAAAATPTLARVGIYSEAANGDLTLLAAIANDTSLFAATGTGYTRTLTSTFHKVQGQRYAVGDLVVSATTMPKIQGASSNAGFSDHGVSPRLSALVASQSDLPPTIANASIATSGVRRYVAMLP